MKKMERFEKNTVTKEVMEKAMEKSLNMAAMLTDDQLDMVSGGRKDDNPIVIPDHLK